MEDETISFHRPPKVIACITTSPIRLPKTFRVIRSLICQSVIPDVIVFFLPRIFKRDGSIIRELPRWWEDMRTQCFSKNISLEYAIVEDVGPATKLLGTLERSQSKGKEIHPMDRIITLDDDIAYPAETISTLVNASEGDLYGAYGSCGFRWTGPGKVETNIHFPDRTRADVLEGFGGVLYRGWMAYAMKPLVNEILNDRIPRVVWTSDDILLSNALASINVPRIFVQGKGYSSTNIHAKGVLSYGLEKDALQNGGGDEHSGGTNPISRYHETFKWLMSSDHDPIYSPELFHGMKFNLVKYSFGAQYAWILQKQKEKNEEKQKPKQKQKQKRITTHKPRKYISSRRKKKV